jgi:integrase
MRNSKKQWGKKMSTLALRAGKEIQDMAAILAAYPSPDRWTQQQKVQAVQFAALLDTAQKMIVSANIIGIDYLEEKEIFLNSAGKSGSVHTQTGYRAALDRLDVWTAQQKINPLELTASQADDFIYSLRRGRSSASVRLDVSAASSFFTWLERRHTGIKNPFRGTKARPAIKSVRALSIPSSEEVETMTKELSPNLAAAVAVMAFRGLRAGMLPGLSISGNKFFGHSKGRDVSGMVPTIVLDTIKAAHLPLRTPFSRVLANTLEKRVARAITKLYKAGKVQNTYSCHDLRHFFAVSEYKKGKDIYGSVATHPKIL